MVRLLSRPDARDPGANDALDAAARTFHHRKTFGDRVAATSPQAVAGVGLTEEERALRVDVGAMCMNAPPGTREPRGSGTSRSSTSGTYASASSRGRTWSRRRERITSEGESGGRTRERDERNASSEEAKTHARNLE